MTGEQAARMIVAVVAVIALCITVAWFVGKI
jgi:flagellar biogenesis protein FliO